MEDFSLRRPVRWPSSWPNDEEPSEGRRTEGRRSERTNRGSPFTLYSGLAEMKFLMRKFWVDLYTFSLYYVDPGITGHPLGLVAQIHFLSLLLSMKTHREIRKDWIDRSGG